MIKKRGSVWVVAALGMGIVVAAAAGLWAYHEQPQFCATCHIMEPYLKSWASSDFLAHTHAEKGIACLDCHEPDLKQQVKEVIAYVQQDYKVPLRERTMPKGKCLSCHEHGSYAEIAERTRDRGDFNNRNPHDSHWGELECHVCHNMHRASVLYCAQCHELTVPEGWIAAKLP
jgi:cytochrome c nitrite reductase small subunit